MTIKASRTQTRSRACDSLSHIGNGFLIGQPIPSSVEDLFEYAYSRPKVAYFLQGSFRLTVNPQPQFKKKVSY